MTNLVHESPVPLYRQVRRAIAARIEDGTLAVGSMTSEQGLGQEFGVSRITIRHALGELAREGRVIRIPGKGTFVAEPRRLEPQSALTSFSENMDALGLRPSYRTLASTQEHPSVEIAEALNTSTDDLVLRIQRLLFADGIPMAIMNAHFPARVWKGSRRLFDAERLDQVSLYSTLERDLGIVLWRARETVEAGRAGHDAGLLDLAPDDLLLLVHRRTVDDSGRPVEYTQLRYRADLYRYSVELFRYGSVQSLAS